MYAALEFQEYQQILQISVSASPYLGAGTPDNLFIPESGTFGLRRASEIVKATKMPETRTTAIAITSQGPRTPGLLPGFQSIFARAGVWASDTAQEFGAVVSALMGPAVFSGYAMAAWSLASNLSWTNSFLFTSGPLSNWIVWFAIALAVHTAANILQRRTAQSNEN
jgi:hypothetical protein